MKKLIACLLLLCLILPVCYAEDLDKTQYVGTWVYTNETMNNGLALELLYLTEDQRAFYIYQTFDAEKSTYSKRYTGTWEPLGGDKIHIEIGDGFLSLNASSLYFSVLKTNHSSGAEYKMFVALGSDMLQRSVDYDLEDGVKQTEQSQSGILVPVGQWRVGEDIPAGMYSIKPGPNVRSTYLKIWGNEPDDWITNGGLVFHKIIKEDNQTIGKIELKDGWLVIVDDPVIFDVPITLGF